MPIAPRYPSLAAGFLGFQFLLLVLCAHAPAFVTSLHRRKAQAAEAIVVFCEYVPLSLILLFVCEGIGAGAFIICVLSIILIIGRLLHSIAVMQRSGFSPMRLVANVMTWTFIACAAGLAFRYACLNI